MQLSRATRLVVRIAGKHMYLLPPAERCYGAGGEDGNFVALHQSMECRDAPAERFERLCHGNSIKHAWRPEARDASCHSNGILPLCSGFGSEDPKGGSRDEVALKVEGVVDRTMHVEEALGGSS